MLFKKVKIFVHIQEKRLRTTAGLTSLSTPVKINLLFLRVSYQGLHIRLQITNVLNYQIC